MTNAETFHRCSGSRTTAADAGWARELNDEFDYDVYQSVLHGGDPHFLWACQRIDNNVSEVAEWADIAVEIITRELGGRSVF